MGPDFEHQSQARSDALPLLKDLAAIGVSVLSVSDLYNMRLNYRRAIPVLLEWLPRIKNPAVRQEIVAALGTPWARTTAANALLKEFEDADATGLDRWRVGAALAKLINDDYFEQIAALVRDRRYSQARQQLVISLGSMRHPAALQVLVELLSDKDVAGQAIVGLRKLGRPEAAEAVRPFLSHPVAWVRSEAKKALARFDNVSRATKQPKIVPLRPTG
jgi:HEAT repeat protein